MNKFFVLFFISFFAMIMQSNCGQYDSQINALFSQTQTGDGTYYGYTSGGSCTLDPTPPSGDVDKTAAMNSPQYYGSATCGMCLQMTGNGVGSGDDPIDGTYIVFVNNLCPECSSGDLDLGDVGSGRWTIDWIAVPCPGNIGSLQYMAQGSHEYYLKLQVRNHRLPVSEVKVKQGSGYVTLSRTEDNFFISSGDLNYPLSDPINIRVVSIQGESLDDQITLANIKSGQPFESKTGVQFSSGGGYTTDLSTATTDFSTATTDFSTNYLTTDYSTNYLTTDYSSNYSPVHYTPISSTSFTSIFTSGYRSSNDNNSSDSTLIYFSLTLYFISFIFMLF